MYKRKRVSLAHVKKYGCAGCVADDNLKLCLSFLRMEENACSVTDKTGNNRFYVLILKEKKDV